MDIDDADRFRRQAEICREESNKACSPVDAASWLRLADDFEKLAERERPLSLRGSTTSARYFSYSLFSPRIAARCAGSAGLKWHIAYCIFTKRKR